MLVPESPYENSICAERDKKSWEPRKDRPDPEREKEQLPVLVCRHGGQ
jgi:hypothetical protein